MKRLSMILGLFLALLVVPMAFAAGEDSVGKCVKGCKLLISNVDVKVDSKTDKNLGNGDSISRDAVPGSKIKFSVKTLNNFTNDEDVDIDNVQITVTIESIDDGDDLEETSKEFDLSADHDKKSDIEFEIPLEVDEDDFTVKILAEGDTKKNGSQESEMSLTLTVNKETHEVRILSNTVTPSELKCGRTTQLNAGVINTGADTEDGVILQISNDDLGVNLKETFDLSDAPFDEDSKFTKTFNIAVPQDAAEGVYPIVSKVTYNNGKLSKTDTADLTVSQCEVSSNTKEEATDTASDKEGNSDDSNVVVVTPPPANQDGNLVTAGTVTAPQLPENKGSIFESQSFLVALIVGEVLLVLVAILLVVAVARRKRKE